jgi:cytochrome c2
VAVWVVLAAMLALGLLSACRTLEPAVVRAEQVTGDPARGQEIIPNYGCGSCHVIPGVRNANSLIGPPLTDWANRWFIVGQLQNTPENLTRFIQAPQSVRPGSAMPDMGVTTPDAEDIAAYLYTLQRRRGR